MASKPSLLSRLMSPSSTPRKASLEPEASILPGLVAAREEEAARSSLQQAATPDVRSSSRLTENSRASVRRPRDYLFGGGRKSKGAEPKAGAVNYTQAESAEAESEFALGELPLLLVDGYNVIGLWPRLKKRKEKNDLDGARRLLLEDLLQFAPRR